MYSTEGLDQEYVKKAKRGTKWDKRDQARYDEMKYGRVSQKDVRDQRTSEGFR